MTNKINIVVCEPLKNAREMEINPSYESLKNLIGNSVSTLDLKTNSVLIVYDDEGKMNGSLPNRAIYQEDELTDFKPNPKHRLVDIMFNTFIICGTDGERLTSLSEEQIEQYKNLYKYPEMFDFDDNGVSIIRILSNSMDFTRVPWSDLKWI